MVNRHGNSIDQSHNIDHDEGSAEAVDLLYDAIIPDFDSAQAQNKIKPKLPDYKKVQSYEKG